MPEKYQMLLLKYATKMDNTQDTYEELEAKISQYYRQMQATDEKAKTGVEETEVSLAQFKGRCFNCKKSGHKASECPNRRQEGQRGQSKNGGSRPVENVERRATPKARVGSRIRRNNQNGSSDSKRGRKIVRQRHHRRTEAQTSKCLYATPTRSSPFLTHWRCSTTRSFRGRHRSVDAFNRTS
jgi:Zinc knuckle